jgi:hypothetical protein
MSLLLLLHGVPRKTEVVVRNKNTPIDDNDNLDLSTFFLSRRLKDDNEVLEIIVHIILSDALN